MLSFTTKHAAKSSTFQGGRKMAVRCGHGLDHSCAVQPSSGQLHNTGRDPPGPVQLFLYRALAPVLEMLFCHQPSGEFVRAANLRHLVRTPWTIVRSFLVAHSVRTNSNKQHRCIAYKTRRRKSRLRDSLLNCHLASRLEQQIKIICDCNCRCQLV
jgi:hypothetical protein